MAFRCGLFIAGLSHIPIASSFDNYYYYSSSCDDGEVATALTLCTEDDVCLYRNNCLPTTEWAADCDTLGDAVELFGNWYTKKLSWKIGQEDVPRGIDCPSGNCPTVSFYLDPYCGGTPIEWDASSAGNYQAVPNNDDTWFKFTESQPVMSIRTSVHLPGKYKGGDKIGLKLVMFPLLDMDKDMGHSDEITCEDWGQKPDIGLDANIWGDTCASPVDRVYCLERDPLAYDDKVDDFVQQLEWDPSWAPFDFAGQLSPSSTAYKFKGIFPLGSAYADFYTTSWTNNEPCRMMEGGDLAIVGPMQGTCIVTKLFEDTNCQANGWEKTAITLGCGCVDRCDTNDWVATATCDLGSWSNGYPKFTNSEVWPQAIRCVWTRIVTQDEPYCAKLFSATASSELVV